jgi:hypothetical protein
MKETRYINRYTTFNIWECINKQPESVEPSMVRVPFSPPGFGFEAFTRSKFHFHFPLGEFHDRRHANL